MRFDVRVTFDIEVEADDRDKLHKFLEDLKPTDSFGHTAGDYVLVACRYKEFAPKPHSDECEWTEVA